MNSCTLVSAFYPFILTKEDYKQCIQSFLRLNANIVLFTTKELAPLFSDLRENKPMYILEIEFEELELWKKYKKQWIKHHEMDHEKHIHTPELYCIWAQKPYFVELAIKENYFNTEYFYWCDFGAFRNENIPRQIIESFPSVTYLPYDKIILNSFLPLDNSDIILHNDGIIGDFKYKNRIIGGLWGGGKLGCLRWKEAYEQMLLKYFVKGRFAGKDQSVMLSAYLANTSLAIIVKPTLINIDIWFFQQYLHSSLDVKYEEDISYKKSREYPNISVVIKGGLGNQLFQIAAAYAYSKKYGGKLQILKDKIHPDGRDTYWDTVLYRVQPYLVNRLPQLPMWNEVGSNKYTEIPPPQGGILLNGYLQSSNYFGSECTKTEIRELFKPQNHILQYLREKYNHIFEQKERVVIVHARRTDYLKNQNNIHIHGPLDIEYYVKSSEEIVKHIENPLFVLISDDVKYWREQIKNIPLFKETILIDGEDDINTFTLLQQFQYYIIANSSYSWWGVWLSKYKKVIAPSKWYGPGGPKDYNDTYEKDWIRI